MVDSIGLGMGTTDRQRAVLERLLLRLRSRAWFAGALLVGSLDEGDELSDVDLLVVVSDFDRPGASADSSTAARPSWPGTQVLGTQRVSPRGSG